MGIQVFKGAAFQRARLVGQRRKLLARIDRTQAAVAELDAKIAAFNLVLREQGVDIDPDYFKPVTPTPRRGYFQHGQISSLLLDTLRRATRPLSTVELLAEVCAAAGVVFKSPQDRYRARRYLDSRLGVYARRGVVTRIRGVDAKHDDVSHWKLARPSA